MDIRYLSKLIFFINSQGLFHKKIAKQHRLITTIIFSHLRLKKEHKRLSVFLRSLTWYGNQLCRSGLILIESSIKHCTLRTSVNEVHVWKAKKSAMDYGNSGLFFTTSKLKFTDRRFASIHLIAFTRTVFSIVLRSTKYSLASYIYIMK